MVTDEMVKRAQAAVRTEAVKRDGGYDLHPVPDWAIPVAIEAVAPIIAAQAKREALEEAARIAARQAEPQECEQLGPMDMETGVRECALDDWRGGSCLCIERQEAAEEMATAIRALASQPPAPPKET